MTEIIFKSACPAEGCTDDETYYWYHASCPSWSDEYLSDQAKIRCTYCGKKWEFFRIESWKSGIGLNCAKFGIILCLFLVFGFFCTLSVIRLQFQFLD